MRRLDLPFNIDIFTFNEKILSMIRPVRSLDTFNGSTKNFHEDGLYSTTTFGTVGTDGRDARYGYINLKVDIIHPVLYKTLIALRSFYADIISSREFAIWDDTLKDFVKSNALEGQTGYHFFTEHVKDIVFEQRDSIKREQGVRLYEKFKDKLFTDKVLVIPAGLRDIEIDENGRASSDEINTFYYKLVAVSNTINPSTVSISPESYNSQRMSLQNTFVEIYDYISAIVEGKKNLMMGKWASRKIFNGTRNVITSMSTTMIDLDDMDNPTINDSYIGLFQTIKGMLPVTIYHLKNEFLGTVFTTMGAPALLTNRKTLLSERVVISNKEYDRWLTNEGLEKLIAYYQENTIRHSPVIIDSYYLGLTYRGPDGTFKLIHGIDELPEGRSKADCKPITYTELLYTAIYHIANKYPIFITRFPITGIGSVYPSKVYLKTTTDVEIRKELGDDWKPLGDDRVAKQFPITDSVFFNSLAPSPSRLAAMGADRPL